MGFIRLSFPTHVFHISRGFGAEWVKWTRFSGEQSFTVQAGTRSTLLMKAREGFCHGSQESALFHTLCALYSEVPSSFFPASEPPSPLTSTRRGDFERGRSGDGRGRLASPGWSGQQPFWPPEARPPPLAGR